MKEKHIIQLTKTERAIVKFIAQKRVEYNVKNGIQNGTWGNHDQLFFETLSYGAEFAFCKRFNLYPNFSWVPGVIPADARIESIVFDIKHTTFSWGDLLVMEKRKLGDSDIYVLVKGTLEDGFWVVGWIDEVGLILPENIKTLPGTDRKNYQIAHDKLASEYSLFKAIDLIRLDALEKRLVVRAIKE